MLAFILSTVAITLSGVLSPGPITAAAVACGARRRHAGAMIAGGHALVEGPLILVLALGAGSFVSSPAVGAAIGLAGGAMLVLMGAQLLRGLGRPSEELRAEVRRHPVAIGVVMTLANPYVLLWWATVGLSLVMQALALGPLALALFALVHWSIDVVWLDLLSLAGYRGSQWFGPRAQLAVAGACGAMLLVFGGKFLYDAAFALAA
jgi:threonine/homoserine/homoserine lactone efflux protein